MKRISLAVALLLLLTGLLTVGCSSQTQETAVLPVSVGPDPDTIDPALNTSADVTTMIIHAFEGLCTLDEKGVPQPGQAESWTLSDDKLTYTFTLRDGLTWSDGAPLTAGDFVYAWNRAMNPDTAAPYYYIFEPIRGFYEGALDVTAPDDKTLVVVLSAVTPYFLELTALPIFYPIEQATIDANGEQWALSADTYISNGPYKLKEWAESSYILLEKNPEYWNVDALGADQIKFMLMNDANAMLSAYETGSILLSDALPSDEISAWRDKEDFHIQGQMGTFYITYNTQAEPFDDMLVRQAFALAIDREFITSIRDAGEEAAGAFVPIGVKDADPTREFRTVGGNYFDPSAEAYESNLTQAKELMTEAGYPGGEGFPTVEYLYFVENPANQVIGEALQQMWGELGVEVTLVPQQWPVFRNSCSNGDFEIACNTWIADYNDPCTFLDMWTTQSGNNDAKWSNAEYDQLISDVKLSSDPAERFEKMHQAEDILFDEWVQAPVYYYVDIYLMSPKLQNAWSSPLGFKYLMYATVTE